MTRKLSLLALPLATLVLLLTGCATSLTSKCTPASAPMRVGVVATTTQVKNFADVLVRGAHQVVGLIEPGASAHDFDPTAKQLLQLTCARALISSGAGLETWLPDLVGASGFHGDRIDASADISVREGDPHIWNDPKLAVQMVRNIAEGLIDTYPNDENTIKNNEDAYLAKLSALDSWVTASINQVPVDQRLLVTNHDAFGYFAEDYGVTIVGSVLPSFDDNVEPTSSEIDALVAKIKETRVKAIFSEASISTRTADAIGRQAGVEVYSGEDALVADSLGPPGSGVDTYISSQIHNVEIMAHAWGVSPPPLPKELS